ncbi:hypothetical protein ACFL47_07800 [Candidatus Latescibacterota bacterium]
MKVNGEEIIAAESDEGLFCTSCWLQKTKDNQHDIVSDHFFTIEQEMDLIYELCNECGCQIGGAVLFDSIR